MKIKGYLIHLCLIDPWCWHTYFKYGSPIRLYLGKRWWTIPGLSGDKRHIKIWGEPGKYWIERTKKPDDTD